ncbi:hypothetical protein AAY473_027855 [Plecturocebus cupreus]
MAGSHWLHVSVTLLEIRAALLPGKQLALSRWSTTLRWEPGVVPTCSELCSFVQALLGDLDSSSPLCSVSLHVVGKIISTINSHPREPTGEQNSEVEKNTACFCRHFLKTDRVKMTKDLLVKSTETGFRDIAQAGLELLGSTNRLALASQNAAITGMNHLPG